MAKPSDYDIDSGDLETDQALADLIEMGLVVDTGKRTFARGKWRIVWGPAEDPGAHHVTSRKN